MPNSSAQLRRDVGQLLIMGFNGTEATAHLRVILRAIAPGGVILFARNVANAAQTHELLSGCQSAAPEPLFRCVDLEGGTVDRLRQIVAPAPSAYDVASTGEKKVFRAHGRVIGEEVRALGFNVDFAPVLDLRTALSMPVMTSRTVAPDPQRVVTYAREFLHGLRDAGVLGCGKHFPGLGS